MPFWLESDTFHDDPRWAALAAGTAVTVDQLQAGYARLMSVAARHASSGWLTADTALSLVRPKVLDRLAAKALADQPPMLHRKGDSCACFDLWQPGYEYLLHWFLKKNPSKRETDRYRTQRREAADPRLREKVYRRDGGACRYCRSGPLKKSGMGRSKDRRRVIHYDHVNPDELAGPDEINLVVSCARCNDLKGNRTPDEADMVLLPAPTEAERALLLGRSEPARLDPSDSDSDSARTATPTASATAVTTAVTTAVRTADPTAVAAGEVRPNAATDAQRQRPALSAEDVGSGRGGQPGAVATGLPGQPPRGSDAPDIYHGRSRAAAVASAGPGAPS